MSETHRAAALPRRRALLLIVAACLAVVLVAIALEHTDRFHDSAPLMAITYPGFVVAYLANVKFLIGKFPFYVLNTLVSWVWCSAVALVLYWLARMATRSFTALVRRR